MMTNGKLSEFGEERVRELCQLKAESIDARNSELRYQAAFVLGLVSLGFLVAFVVGVFGTVYLLITGGSVLSIVITTLGNLVGCMIFNALGGLVDNPDIRVGD